MKDLMKYVALCRRDLDFLRIPYGTVSKWEINTRAKRRWGQCKQIAKGEYIISISHRLLEDAADEQALKDTIVHELLHTVPGCMNHTGKWKQLAERVNRACAGYHIQRVTSETEKGLEHLEYRYILQCTQCGAMAFRCRAGSFVKHPERYRCALCGGAFQRVR